MNNKQDKLLLTREEIIKAITKKFPFGIKTRNIDFEAIELANKAQLAKVKQELCANCDIPLLREGELYQKLEQAVKRERKVKTPFEDTQTDINGVSLRDAYLIGKKAERRELKAEIEKRKLEDEGIRYVVSRYYQECNEKNPPEIPLAMVIGERIAQEQLQFVLRLLEEK